ncbi:MAG: superoxide dismutase family protein [Ardenticatenaceae bacterium]|nr:superoxide dismutase family protein [Ardenticatenaceae bacterium]HBY93314.1 hypothetical protein [Chloroflexota bacterium]
MRTTIGLILTLLVLVSPSGVALAQGGSPANTSVKIVDPVGRTVGNATFTPTPNGAVEVQVAVAGFDPGPGGDHRLAITDVGRCESKNLQSAGDEVAVLPPIQFYPNGSATYQRTTERFTLDTLHDPSGSTLIIYAGTNPDSDRIGCAVIFAAESGTPPTGATEIYKQSPWWPYLSAHINDQSPPDIVGGPIELQLTQESGVATWVFPGPRQLDPTIFGTVDDPKATEAPPVILGAPMKIRTALPDGTFVTNVPTPFSNMFAVTQGAMNSVHMAVVDATATDGATTKDKIDFVATFEAPGGKGVYRIEVQKPAAHGWFIPTAGGVATNFIQHGITKWGTQLMPTEFDYVGFWGLGDIYLNDQKIDQNRLVHVMLTEFVRKNPYDLVFDAEVNPKARHLHVIVPPFTPKGQSSPVKTGFMLPNGMEQPFFHVMFPGIQVTAGARSTK